MALNHPPSMETKRMRKTLLAAVAAIALTGSAFAAEIGIGVGSLTTGAGAAGVTGAQSNSAGGSISAIAGITAGGVVAGQTSTTQGVAGGQASCTSGPNCTSVAEQGGTSSTTGGVTSGGFALGAAGSLHAGQATGAAGGVQAGQASTQFNYLNLFANP